MKTYEIYEEDCTMGTTIQKRLRNTLLKITSD